MNIMEIPDVVIKQSEYEKLIRDSERLNIVKEHLEKAEYTTLKFMCELAGV